MPRKNKKRSTTDMSIFFILDGSGSMASVQDDVVGGVNEFIKKQQEDKDGTTLTLTVFDNTINKVYDNEPVGNVKPVTKADTLIGGGTALLDAIGKTLTEAENASLPGKKLVVIYTDGHENQSSEFKNADIKKLIERLEGEGDWTFTYMSADVDNFANARAIGVAAGNYVMTTSGTTTSNFSGLSSSAHAHKSNVGVSMSRNFVKDYEVEAAVASHAAAEGKEAKLWTPPVNTDGDPED